jgi:RDD family
MAPREAPGAERYRGEVARKSRTRGGATRATRAPSAARRGGPAQTRSGKTGTAQLTAPPPTEANPAATGANQAEATASAYPGQGLGLPERGPGSVASMPRRVLALLIDWLLSMVIAYWLTHNQFWTIAVFAVETYILTALTGTTVGKRLAGIRVVRLSGGPVGFGWALVRTVILLTVVPPLLTDRDLRGLHDRASDTVVVRI